MLLTLPYVLNSADFQNDLDLELSDAMLTEVLKSYVKVCRCSFQYIIENNADLSFVSDELCSGFDLISINKLDPEI